MSRWRFQLRKGIPIIPGLLRLNLSMSGFSWTWHLGRLASWNSRTGDQRVNPPGPGSFVRRGHRRAQRTRRRTGGQNW